MPNPEDRLAPTPRRHAPPRSSKRLDRRITIATFAATVVGALAAVAVVPEFRCFLHLGCEGPPNVTPSSNTAAGGIVNTGSLLVQGNLTIGNTIGTTPFKECDKPYLQMLLQDRIGALVMQPPEVYYRRFRIELGNPTSDCTAIVQRISAEVVAVERDDHPSFEAMTAKYVYQITVSPTDVGKDILVTEDNFNYTPHSAPDLIVVDVGTSREGYIYGIRFVVSWSDLRTKKVFISKSWVVAAPFPSGQAEDYGPDPWPWRHQMLAAWRQRYDRSQDAVRDGSAKGPPYKIEYEPMQ